MDSKDLTDKDLMPFGKYKDQALSNVPATYLFWAYDNILTLDPRIKKYIDDNWDVLKEEAKKKDVRWR